MKKAKSKKPLALRVRKPMPPPTRVHMDRKKESKRTSARGPAAKRRIAEDDRPTPDGSSIVVAARVGFEELAQIPHRLQNVDFPIELALPWQYSMWQRAEPQYDYMLECLEALDLQLASVHATQGRISDSAFLSWGPKTCKLAERLGGTVVTVHPNRAKKQRGSHQELARQYLRSVQHETVVTVSVETFGGKDRVFRPEEIMEFGLPMTLDTAHIHSDERVIELIKSYWQHMSVVHLSGRNEKEQHLPVDRFCLDVVQYLVGIGWSGSIVLEYLPWHHYRLRSDIKLVRRALSSGVRADEIPPPTGPTITGSTVWSAAPRAHQCKGHSCRAPTPQFY